MRRAQWPAIPFCHKHRIARLRSASVDYVACKDPRMPDFPAPGSFSVYGNCLQLKSTRADVETLAPLTTSRDALQGIILACVVQVHRIR